MHQMGLIPPGTILGHEFCGEVVESRHGHKAGDRVCALPSISCGGCERCRSGLGAYCTKQEDHRPGRVERGLCGVRHRGSPRDRASSRRSRLDPGRPGRAPGGGTARGERGTNPARGDLPGDRRRPHRPGHDPLGPPLRGRSGDRVRDRTGAARPGGTDGSHDGPRPGRPLGWTRGWPSSLRRGPTWSSRQWETPGVIQEAIGRVRFRGRVVVAGLCPSADTIQPLPATFKEVAVRFVLAYEKDDFQYTVDMMEQERIEPLPVVTDRIGLDDVPEAFEALAKSRLSVQGGGLPRLKPVACGDATSAWFPCRRRACARRGRTS